MLIPWRESREARIERLGKWHRWFAWHPIKIGESEGLWLETVWRRGEHYLGVHLDFSGPMPVDDYRWSYRPLSDFEVPPHD